MRVLLAVQVPQMRSRLVEGQDWKAIAKHQEATVFSGDDSQRILAFADALDQLDDLTESGQPQVRSLCWG